MLPIQLGAPDFRRPLNAAGRLSDPIRRLVHSRVQITDALLPFIIFAPLFVRQAHIGVQFQGLDLFSEQVDKLGLEFFDGFSHSPLFPKHWFRRISGEGAQTGMSQSERKLPVAGYFNGKV